LPAPRYPTSPSYQTQIFSSKNAGNTRTSHYRDGNLWLVLLGFEFDAGLNQIRRSFVIIVHFRLGSSNRAFLSGWRLFGVRRSSERSNPSNLSAVFPSRCLFLLSWGVSWLHARKEGLDGGAVAAFKCIRPSRWDYVTQGKNKGVPAPSGQKKPYTKRDPKV
jgi:hypothetical protein